MMTLPFSAAWAGGRTSLGLGSNALAKFLVGSILALLGSRLNDSNFQKSSKEDLAEMFFFISIKVAL